MSTRVERFHGHGAALNDLRLAGKPGAQKTCIVVGNVNLKVFAIEIEMRWNVSISEASFAYPIAIFTDPGSTAFLSKVFDKHAERMFEILQIRVFESSDFSKKCLQRIVSDHVLALVGQVENRATTVITRWLLLEIFFLNKMFYDL